MVNLAHPLDTTKPHPVDIHSETVLSVLVAVSSMFFGVFYKLTTTVHADIVLLASLVTNMSEYDDF